MINVIPAAKRNKSTSQQFGEAFSGALKSGVDYYANQMEGKEQQQRDKETEEKYGVNLSGRSPEERKILLTHALQGQNEERKFTKDLGLENENYNDVKESFGEKFAKLWKVAPVGGKTELLKHGMDAKIRGENLEEILANIPEPETLKQEKTPEQVPQIKNGKYPSDFNWPKYDKRPPGFTPKEWTDERKTWRKDNLPIFEKNNVKSDALNADVLATKKLDQLNKSKKLPEGMGRFLINPETGEPYGLSQLSGAVSPEVQEWAKTTARFQNRAKDAFGSRVTNFDLMSYMKQFPSLMNTEEGRNRILKMMEVNYDLDNQYVSSLQSIYHKYGLNGISPEDADELARKSIKDKTEELRIKYLGLNALNEEGDLKEKGLSGKMVDVVGPDGQIYEIDEKELDLLPEGFTRQ